MNKQDINRRLCEILDPMRYEYSEAGKYPHLIIQYTEDMNILMPLCIKYGISYYYNNFNSDTPFTAMCDEDLMGGYEIETEQMKTLSMALSTCLVKVLEAKLTMGDAKDVR